MKADLTKNTYLIVRTHRFHKHRPESYLIDQIYFLIIVIDLKTRHSIYIIFIALKWSIFHPDQ